jgi:ABC-type protease/lipase transport system fused ATPase/permease subunit
VLPEIGGSRVGASWTGIVSQTVGLVDGGVTSGWTRLPVQKSIDTVLAACRKAMADALVIDECRLADEYDARRRSAVRSQSGAK